MHSTCLTLETEAPGGISLVFYTHVRTKFGALDSTTHPITTHFHNQAGRTIQCKHFARASLPSRRPRNHSKWLLDGFACAHEIRECRAVSSSARKVRGNYCSFYWIISVTDGPLSSRNWPFLALTQRYTPHTHTHTQTYTHTHT